MNILKSIFLHYVEWHPNIYIYIYIYIYISINTESNKIKLKYLSNFKYLCITNLIKFIKLFLIAEKRYRNAVPDRSG